MKKITKEIIKVIKNTVNKEEFADVFFELSLFFKSFAKMKKLPTFT